MYAHDYLRLELVRSYVDLGNAKVKKDPDLALSVWLRATSIWEVLPYFSLSEGVSITRLCAEHSTVQ